MKTITDESPSTWAPLPARLHLWCHLLAEEDMGGPMDPDWPCAKGPVRFGLDTISSMLDGRARLEQLRNAITALASVNYRGLETALEVHVLRPIYPNPNDAAAVAAHLNQHWFDETSSSAYFPAFQPIAPIYAEGVITAVNLSMNSPGPAPVPINAWWVVDQPHVKLVSLALTDSGDITRSDRVTLLVLTPRPSVVQARMAILDKRAVAWVTERERANRKIITRKTP